MRQNTIVWDLETIPDPERPEPGREELASGDTKKTEGSTSNFPKHLYHKIACLGTLVAFREKDFWRVRSIAAPTIGEFQEVELIESFVSKVAALKAQLVTFNGSSFDLPVFRYRAMIHRVSAPALYERSYFNRYTEDAVDLCDVLSSFDARSRISLQEICVALGLGGKPSGVNGSQVENLVRKKQYQELSDYCATDVVNTYRVWLRYELFRGTLSDSGFRESEASLSEYINQNAAPTSHLLKSVEVPSRD